MIGSLKANLCGASGYTFPTTSLSFVYKWRARCWRVNPAELTDSDYTSQHPSPSLRRQVDPNKSALSIPVAKEYHNPIYGNTWYAKYNFVILKDRLIRDYFRTQVFGTSVYQRCCVQWQTSAYTVLYSALATLSRPPQAVVIGWTSMCAAPSMAMIWSRWEETEQWICASGWGRRTTEWKWSWRRSVTLEVWGRSKTKENWWV